MAARWKVFESSHQIQEADQKEIFQLDFPQVKQDLISSIINFV